MPWWTRVLGASSVAAALVVATVILTDGTTSARGVRPVMFATAANAAENTPTPTVVATSVAPEPTTVAVPVPVPTPKPAAPIVAPVAAPDPVPDAEPVAMQAPDPPAAGAAERCSSARQWVAAHGLVLPAGFAFRCPDPAIFADGASRWGTTCWNCGAPGGSYIAINIDRIGSSDDTLHYVVAHETCHAIQDVTTGVTSEESADACAAAHGAPPP